MDAEEASILLACAGASRIALDSQGAITRVSQLGYTQARSWIEEELQRMAGRAIGSWRGSKGTAEWRKIYKEADRMARRTGYCSWIGAWIPKPAIATPALAGICRKCQWHIYPTYIEFVT